MTYRGGQRRDSPRSSSGNYGGGNRRQNYGSGNQVNPWQGGVAPGNSSLGSQLGGLGLLPRPAQSGVLSSLTTPEAQLAMATNLLNKILSPQQNQTSNVPSLLSLPGPMNGNMSYGDYHSRSSFADRHRDRQSDRRMQPYNKSGLNRRGDAKSRLGKSRISDKSSSSKPKKRDSDDGEKQNGDASEDNEKRDDDDDTKDDDDDEDKVLGAKYAGVPNSLLSCHVCHKNMWDSCSFEKHISGRRHQMMMEKLDETYKIKVELLRHEQRSAESQRELEIERLERQGKKIFNNKREYCTMCDLHFYGNLISHRKKDRHQKLKSFLHPKCHLCHKEFPNRLEWDDHKLSAGHMMKVSEYYHTTRPGVKEEDMDANDIESLDGGDVSVFDELVEDINKEKKKLIVNIDEFPTTVEDYDAAAPLGADYVTEVQGHLCKLCNKFINSSEEAAVHSRTLTHYKNYAAIVKLKLKAEKEKEAADRAAELKAKREGGKKKSDLKDDNAEDGKMDDGEDEAEAEAEGEEHEAEESESAAEEPAAKVKDEKEEVEIKMEVDAAVEEKVDEEVEEEVLTRGRGKTARGRGKARRGK